MNPDLFVIIIAGGFGILAGFFFGFCAAGLYLNTVRRRTIRETWDSARLYYTRKQEERV